MFLNGSRMVTTNWKTKHWMPPHLMDRQYGEDHEKLVYGEGSELLFLEMFRADLYPQWTYSG